jgi:CRISPR-associated protein Csx3
VDIGGIPDTKNEIICTYATHAILLTGDYNRLIEWRAFCDKLKLRIIAEIYSDYTGEFDHPLERGIDDIYRGSIHHLERGDLSLHERPTIIELAHILVNMVTEEAKSYGIL